MQRVCLFALVWFEFGFLQDCGFVYMFVKLAYILYSVA